MTPIINQIQSVVEPALSQWYRLQAADPYGKFYLFYREARDNESISVPIIAQDKPSDEYELAMPEALSGFISLQQNKVRCVEALRQQPILGEG